MHGCIFIGNYEHLYVQFPSLIALVMEGWWCKFACNERPMWGGGREEQRARWLRRREPGEVRWPPCCGDCLSRLLLTRDHWLYTSVCCVMWRIHCFLCVCAVNLVINMFDPKGKFFTLVQQNIKSRGILWLFLRLFHSVIVYFSQFTRDKLKGKTTTFSEFTCFLCKKKSNDKIVRQ